MISDILEYEYEYAFLEANNYNARKILLQFAISDFSFEYNSDTSLIVEKIVREVEKFNGLVIPVLDITNCGITKDFASLLKLIVGVRRKCNNKDIILFGIDDSITIDFIRQYTKEGDTDEIASTVLIYTKFNEYFLPIVIWGNSFPELVSFNYTYLNIFIKTDGLNFPPEKSGNNKQIKSEFFYNESFCLKEFDVLISYQGKSLFELFVTQCLNTPISNKINETLFFQDKNFSGYKIANGHFKIGSRIHISDFYYAKRMFQTSDYVNKFSILLVRDLLSGGEEKLISKIFEGGLTILGYAKYSKLIILRVEQYLKEKLREFIQDGIELKINTNIIRDRDEPTLLENASIIYSNLLLIIPISSTLSTSVKIVEYFASSNPFHDKKIIEPVLNIIIVADRQAQQTDYKSNSRVIPKMNTLYNYNWRRIDYTKKNIELQVGGNKLLLNSFMLLVFTKWFKVNDCHICFGNDDLISIKELPLIDTDKASITPHLIMGDSPVFVKNSVEKKEPLLHGSYHYYGHFKISDSHSIHFIDPRVFLEVHYWDIKEWLIDRRKQEWYKCIKGSVCIITPDGDYNSDFVYLVNEILFNHSATIVRYNAATAFTSNFKILYGSLIENAENIIYVDDQVSKGMSFERIQHFIGVCCHDKPFIAFVTMICSADNDTANMIKNGNRISHDGQVKNSIEFEYFSNIRIHSLLSNKIPCPICKAKDDYIDFAEAASLDSTRYYLYKKAQRLNGCEHLVYNEFVFNGYDNSIDEDDLPTFDDDSHEKYATFFKNPFKNNNFLKLLVEDYINKIDKLNEKIGSEHFIDNLINEIANELNSKYESQFGVDEITASLIKVLSFAPYSQYYPIRMAIFSYLNKKLDSEYAKLEGDYKIDIQFLRITKLLLRRISVLKGNYIIKKQNFVKLYNFYRNYEQTRYEDNRKIDTSIQTHLNYLLTFLYSLGVDVSDKRKLSSFLYNSPIYYTIQPQIFFNHRVTRFDISSIIIDIVYRFENKIRSFLEANRIGFEQIDTKDELNVMKLLYCCRALQNLYYKRELRSDYHYFMAHIVKEITFNSDARALHIDKIINSEYPKIEKPRPSGLVQLLRIIKMENTGILRKFLDSKFVVDLCELNIDLNNQDIVISKISELLENPAHYYEIESLLCFLHIEKETTWRGKEGEILPIAIKNSGKIFNVNLSFFHFMRLYLFLVSQSDNTDKEPPEKIKFIIENIKKILSINDEGVANAFLAIRHTPYNKRETTLDDLIVFNEVGDIITKDRLAKPFSLEVFNGLTLREMGTFQNLFVFQKDSETKKWSSLKAYYTNKFGKSYQGDYLGEYSEPNFFSGYKDMLFFRISNLYYKTNNDEIIDVVNNGQAVLVIASQRNTPYKPEKLRYLLLLKEHLSKFFYKHYTNDSFKSFLIEKEIHDYYTTLRHGFGSHVIRARDLYNQLIDEYDKIVSRESNNIDSKELSEKIVQLKEEYNLFFNLALEEVNISAIMAEGVSGKQININDNNLYPISAIYLDDLEKLIKKLSRVIALSSGFDYHFGDEDYFVNECRNFKSNVPFKGNIDLLYLIISELFINIRKRNWNENFVSIKISWSISETNSTYVLRQENTFSENVRNHIIGGQKGLSMIRNILRFFFQGDMKAPEIDKNKFSIEIILSKL